MAQKHRGTERLLFPNGAMSSASDEKCSCGYGYGDGRGTGTSGGTQLNVVDSFVHLPLHVSQGGTAEKNVAVGGRQNGVWDNYLLSQRLEQAVQEPSDPPRLCFECASR